MTTTFFIMATSSTPHFLSATPRKSGRALCTSGSFIISWGEPCDGICCAISPGESSPTTTGTGQRTPLELGIHFWNQSSTDVFINAASEITHIRETEQGVSLLGLRVEASRRQGKESNRVASQTINSWKVVATPLENLPDGEYRIVRVEPSRSSPIGN